MREIIYIKNMVCPRCISAVSNILEQLKILYVSIKLGEVKLVSSLSPNTKNSLSKALQNSGFSLIDDRKSQLIEQMKTLVVEKIHHSNDETDLKWADIISGELNLDYKYLMTTY